MALKKSKGRMSVTVLIALQVSLYTAREQSKDKNSIKQWAEEKRPPKDTMTV